VPAGRPVAHRQQDLHQPACQSLIPKTRLSRRTVGLTLYEREKYKPPMHQ
jgi:hypothetical protein